MAKARKAGRRVPSRRFRARAKPYKFPSSKRLVARNMFAEDCSKCLEKRDWENVICSVCMECPHNAVLLLCSSHDKGCRPYMCGTSFRYSNCLDQYKKASAKLKTSGHQQINKSELGNLTCPLCRGQENCVYAGTFKELRKHMKVDHPSAKPREVDPDVEQNWRRLEIEHDRDDVMSTIRSTMPGTVVYGDYVIERNNANGSDSDEGGDDDGIDAAFDSNDSTTINRGTSELNFSEEEEEEEEEERHSNSNSLASRMRRQGRVLLGRSGRRRRDREANQNTGPPPR
ncbi:unnamed protein product [Arabidopsis thaliana]|uniref:(thale cress) hypothetical protein n=1 Tax=Arabidopsis thaliana TaxID=3702 RepID=A0A7G2E362_ARATH|nr:unnamed protein product [Arabidopsis thaliana]